MEYAKFIPIEEEDKQNIEIKEGNILSGTVKSIQPYGAFVEIAKDKVGLLYIEDISVARMKSPSERLKIGQNIKVMVKSIKKDKIFLSSKELYGSWEDNIKNFEQGEIVKGIARETAKNKQGIFIELKPNLVGMAEYKEGIKYGQDVDVYIKKIIPEKKKIKLIIFGGGNKNGRG